MSIASPPMHALKISDPQRSNWVSRLCFYFAALSAGLRMSSGSGLRPRGGIHLACVSHGLYSQQDEDKLIDFHEEQYQDAQEEYDNEGSSDYGENEEEQSCEDTEDESRLS